MHWFLWMLFAFYVISSVFSLSSSNGDKPPKPYTQADLRGRGILNACLAIGLLVYGGII